MILLPYHKGAIFAMDFSQFLRVPDPRARMHHLEKIRWCDTPKCRLYFKNEHIA